MSVFMPVRGMYLSFCIFLGSFHFSPFTLAPPPSTCVTQKGSTDPIAEEKELEFQGLEEEDESSLMRPRKDSGGETGEPLSDRHGDSIRGFLTLSARWLPGYFLGYSEWSCYFKALCSSFPVPL